MRKLKFHEQKLLKKVDFLHWKRENQDREEKATRRYHLQNRDDYKKYNKLCGLVTKLTTLLSKLDPTDSDRIQITDDLLNKLYRMGIIPVKQSLEQTNELSTSAFCRRRLAVVIVKLKMAENLKEASTFIEQGHVRVGPDTVMDPAYHVTRDREDFVTWVTSSKIKRKVMKYNDQLDDYDLLE